MSVQQNYVRISNWLHDALKESDRILQELPNEELFQLQGLINEEAAADRGRSLTISLLKQVVDAEAAFRIRDKDGQRR